MRINESPVSQNYLTDLIHIISLNSCLSKKDKWSDFYNFDENKEQNKNNILVTTTDEENQEH